jgi:hypothetical protein
MTTKQWIKRLKKLKQHRLVSEKTFLRHLEVAIRACASNRGLNVYREEFPNEVMEVERLLHLHSTI